MPTAEPKNDSESTAALPQKTLAQAPTAMSKERKDLTKIHIPFIGCHTSAMLSWQTHRETTAPARVWRE